MINDEQKIKRLQSLVDGILDSQELSRSHQAILSKLTEYVEENLHLKRENALLKKDLDNLLGKNKALELKLQQMERQIKDIDNKSSITDQDTTKLKDLEFEIQRLNMLNANLEERINRISRPLPSPRGSVLAELEMQDKGIRSLPLIIEDALEEYRLGTRNFWKNNYREVLISIINGNETVEAIEKFVGRVYYDKDTISKTRIIRSLRNGNQSPKLITREKSISGHYIYKIMEKYLE